MRYLGQGYDVNVTFTPGDSHDATTSAIRHNFENVYLKLYGRIYADLPLELMTFRLSASARRILGHTGSVRTPDPLDGKNGTRRAYCPKERAWLEFSVYRRDRIAVNLKLAGPAIVEENESTTVVPSGAEFHVDEHGSLIVNLAK
jgi:N-methylhydantoinase A